MNNLPLEILHNIFILLPLIQKQECLFVCHRWEKLIRERSLFQTASIYNKQLYKHFMQVIERFPAMRYQVEDLTLFECFEPDHDKRKILTTFPNLRELKLCVGDSDATMTPYEINTEEQFELSTRNRIDYLNDYGMCELTLFLANSENASYLTFLDLNFHSLKAPRTTVLPHLKNMPVLRRLLISNTDFTMDDCEIIHSNLPSLKSISLKKVVYLTSSVPAVKVTAPLVTYLSIQARRMPLEKHLDWIRYILMKYPNLVNLDYWYHTGNEGEAKRFHSDGYLPLLQTLSRTLKCLNISNIHDATTLMKLDDYGCQFSALTLQSSNPVLVVNTLSRSNQAKSLKRLAIVTDKHINFKWLKKMKSLQSLELLFLNMNTDHLFHLDFMLFLNIRKYLTLDLCQMFKACPDTIEHIRITSTLADFNPRSRKKYPSIKSLDMDEVRVPSGIDKFISKSFPHLNSLSLINCVEDDVTLSFPDHHFSYFEIMALQGCSDDGTNVQLITSCSKKPRFYSGGYKESRKGYTQLEHYPGPIPIHDIIFDNFITVTCASLKELVIDHLTMFLPSNNSEFKL